MNKETFEALKRIVTYFDGLSFYRDYMEQNQAEKDEDIKKVKAWIEEELEIDYDMEQEAKDKKCSFEGCDNTATHKHFYTNCLYCDKHYIINN